MLPEKFSNENFSVLVSEGMINLWNEFELTRKNFVKSKNSIIRLLKGRETQYFNNKFINEVDGGLRKINSKIVFSELDYSAKYNKNKFEKLSTYLKIDKYENEDYKCEFCGVPRFKLNWCHIVKRGMSNKEFDHSIINYLFMCGNCHDDTEKHWNEIKNRKFYKNQMRKLINKRKKVNKKLLKSLKSDISKYRRGIRLIENIKKEIENYKKQERILNEKFNEKKKELIYKIKKGKNKISKEVENLIKKFRKKYDNIINKIHKKYVNLKIVNKKVKKIKRQKSIAINKKRKLKKEKHRKLEKIRKQESDQLTEKWKWLSNDLYERFKDRIRKIVKINLDKI